MITDGGDVSHGLRAGHAVVQLDALHAAVAA
jgi:hypothetical protein